MTLKEAVEYAGNVFRDSIEHEWCDDAVEAFRLILDTARQHLDDTAEIVLPCPTCRGKGEVIHGWGDGTAAVSPCPTCRPKLTPVPQPDSQ